ncbi:MAG: sulfatase-like hydrolase/transferase, partial [Faecalibacterium sp.]
MLKKPNIVVFMTDQQNAQTIKPDHAAITPNIDKFYGKSLVFEKAFCASPHCCPSRASFFSGLYPSQHGIWHNVEVDNAISRELLDDVTLFPELLSKNGYRTVFSGKWHVSGYEGPADRGFQEVLRECTTNNGRTARQNIQYCRDWERVYNKKENIDLDGVKKSFGQISRAGYPVYHQFGEDPNPFGDATTVEVACEHIRGRAAKNNGEGTNKTDAETPFFYYVGTIGPHDPYCPPQEFIDLYKDVELTLPKSYEDDLRDKPNLYRRTRDRFDLTREEQIESMRRYLAFVSFEDSL